MKVFIKKYRVYIIAGLITLVLVTQEQIRLENFIRNCESARGSVNSVRLHGSGNYSVIEYTYDVGPHKYRAEGTWPGSQNPCEEGLINCDSVDVCYSLVNPSRSILEGSKSIVEAKVDD